MQLRGSIEVDSIIVKHHEVIKEIKLFKVIGYSSIYSAILTKGHRYRYSVPPVHFPGQETSQKGSSLKRRALLLPEVRLLKKKKKRSVLEREKKRK